MNMPTTYTHYRFGKDVLKELSKPLKRTINIKRELYDIGLHGPDLLFYYHPLYFNHVNKTGSKLHKKSAYDFFLRAGDVIKVQEDIMAAKSYIYGFICHYVLDSVCHKYVEKIIYVSGIGHSEIEMEWDRRLMVKDGLDPLTFVPIKHLIPGRENAEVIAPFFEGIKVREVEDALKGMRWALRQLMPLNKTKDIIVKGALKAAHLENKYGLFMSHEENKEMDKYCDILNGVYDECIMFAVKLILNYKSFLDGKEELLDDFKDCFGCGDNWQSVEL